MATLTLQIDNHNLKGIAFLNYIRSLARTDNFLFIEEKEELVEEKNNILMQEIEQGLREVKMTQEGKLRRKSLNELIDELD